MLLAQFAFALLSILATQKPVPPGFESLALQARALPPEFSADILLKLAASPRLTNAQWKRGLIEDAFLNATAIPTAYPVRGNVRVDLPAILAGRVARLTFQTQAVEAMRPLDPQRTITMFQDIGLPQLPKLSCQEAHVPDVSAYYQTAADLFNRAFTPAQREKGDDIQFLRRLLAIDSPSQVVHALKLLDQVELSAVVRSELTASLMIALEHINGGDREFSYREPYLVSAALPEMHELGLMTALRAYIVRHLSGPRCSDQMLPGQLPESAMGFNKLISQIDRTGLEFHPITLDEIKPLRDDGTYGPVMAIQSEAGHRVGGATEPLREETPGSAEWTANYAEALRLMQDWKAAEEASANVFYCMATSFYQTLVDVPVSGPVHQTALLQALRFLEQQYGSIENHGLWFYGYRNLFSNSGAQPNQDEAWFTEQLLASPNAVIRTYAQLQKLLGIS